MREIKFRAWMPKEQKWYTGGAVQLTAMLGNTFGLSEANGRIIELQQYTGLKDKNGREIYEGDVVGYRDDSIGMVKGHYIKYKVVYGFGAFTFEPLDLGDEHEPCTLPVEVIGNIHENPELIPVNNTL